MPVGTAPPVILYWYGPRPPLAPPNAPHCVQSAPTLQTVEHGCVAARAVKTPMVVLEVSVWSAESLTLTVNRNFPAVVFLPVITPAEDSDSPGGKVPPETDQV